MMRFTSLLICVSIGCVVPRCALAQAAPNPLPPSSEVPLNESQTVTGNSPQDVTEPQATTGQAPASESGNDAGTQTETSPQPSIGPKYEAYQKMLNEGREINREIDRLFGEMPIGFPAKQLAYRQRIEQLKARQNELAAQISGAAIEAFEESPQSDVDLVKYVYNKMSTCINPRTETQKFDPQLALKLADLLISKGAVSRDLYFNAFRAAFALQDFDQAETLLTKVEETSKTPLQPTVRERFEETRQKWSRELEIRRLEAASDDLPRVKFETTAGDFVVELFENQAPQTVANFISLVEQGFYDGLTFHLVKPGILIQGGCPVGNGTGDPGYMIPCECYRDEIRHHFAGTISMSNKGRDTGGSQFFISEQPNPSLDGKYTVFGRIIENMDVIFDVSTVDKTRPNRGTLAPTVVKKITVLRKRDHLYQPTKVVTESTPGSDAAAAPATDTNPENPDKSTPDTGDPGGGEPAPGRG